MSSPAAAIASLARQIEKRGGIDEMSATLDDDLMSGYVYDPTDRERNNDDTPTIEVTIEDGERRKLREFLKSARKITPKEDHKLQIAIKRVKELLTEGLKPIVWCRYIDTAEYVAAQLQQELEKKKGSQIRVISITGKQSEDEREERLVELKTYSQRVMVATDCLSEGVNLQTHFQAALHYDLPWNPNRLEQREGRIDRYGQAAPVVKTFLLYGSDNKIDLAVLEVLIRKAVAIHKTLGVNVPIPIDSATVQTAIFKSLFEHPGSVQQLTLDLFADADSPVSEVNRRWDAAIDREKRSRTKFAQHSIKPVEVQQELAASDRILGSTADVERFVLKACERLGHSLKREKHGWMMATPPACVRSLMGDKPRSISFASPTPEGVEYIGRNHPLVERLANFLLEDSLTNLKDPTAARCGYIVTTAVKQRTNIFLLRLRHLIGDLDAGGTTAPLMAEECIVTGFTGSPSNPQWLSTESALELLQTAQPTANANLQLKQREIGDLLVRVASALPNRYPELMTDLELLATERAEDLATTYQRIRAITKKTNHTNVYPQMPMDLLAVLILNPQ
jgi:hypothetical protein